jgi:hypothetical protein
MMVTKLWKYIAAFVLIAACKSDEKTKAPPVVIVTKNVMVGSGSASADPWAGKPARTTPETPAEKKQRAEVALARVASIMPKLAKVRELTFDHDIPREYQTTEDFKTFVHAEISKEMPKAKAADESAALFHIGLLTKPGNLAELEEQAFTTQAGAYYDPAAKKFFVVMVPDNDLMLDTMSAHELTHGLQDQHFNLQKFMPEDDKSLDDDHQSARRFVAEGDATFTMTLYMYTALSNKPITPEVITMLKKQLADFSKTSPEEMIKQQAAGFGASMDPEIKKSIDSMGDIPLTVLIPMIDSYTQGASLVAEAYNHGGWVGVNALYSKPPESTEQALHPATKMYPNRDRPKLVTISTATDKPENKIEDIVLGELQWQVYFQLWLPAQRTIASEGWGGDHVIVIKRGDGRLVARIATAWDTEKDATEFAQAYVGSLKARLPKGSGDPAKGGFDRGDGAGKIFMKQVGMNVFIADGADDAAWLDDLIKATTIK